MARVGRGRARGGRIIDLSDLSQGLGHGKIIIGRGTSILPSEDPRPHMINSGNASDFLNTGLDAKKTLLKELTEFVNTGQGCFIHITINFFAHDDDVQYYIDKVMESVLKSATMVEKFTMCVQMITLHKQYGENIKQKMFSKLQTVFKEIVTLMADSSSLSELDRVRVVNFSQLIGLLYFHFRPALLSLHRYDVLAVPALQCMNYLLKGRGVLELRTLVKLIVLNYAALNELQAEKTNQLSVDLHSALVEHKWEEGGSMEERMWLLCAVDYSTGLRSELPPHLAQYYATQLGEQWTEVAVKSPVQILADIPPDVLESQMDKFDVLVEEYNKHKFVTL